MKVGLLPAATPPRICRTSVGAGIGLPQMRCRTNGVEVPPTSNPFLTPEQYCIPSKHDGEFTSEKQMHASKVLGLEPVVFSKRSTRWAPERDRLRPANRYA